jgi:hypothetical protein
MERVRMTASVASLEGYHSSSDGRLVSVKVTLSNGMVFSTRPENIPELGSTIPVTFGGSDPELPFVTEEDRAEARHVLSELGRS